jgi:multicomponent Na+:H+ antiporter subunit D
VIGGVGTLAAVFSGHSLVAEVRAEKHTLFQAGFLLCQAGLVGLVFTGDAFNAFVFLEVSSIGTYALVACRREARQAGAAGGVQLPHHGDGRRDILRDRCGFLYAATGTLNMADMAARLATLDQSTVVQAGFAFIIVGARRQGGDVPAAWLATRGIRRRTIADLGAARGDSDQGSDLL